MFTVDGIQKFHGWTHASLNLVLDHLSTIPLGHYFTGLPNFALPTLHEQMIHVLNCEGLWIHTLQGFRYVDREPEEFPSVAEMKLLQQEIVERSRAYLSGLTIQQLNTDIEMLFPDGSVTVRTPALVFHHVFTHAFHHKGQIAAMCRALGYPAPATDMNHFE